MVSKTKKNTKRTSKAIISEEIMSKEIVNCKNEEIFGNGSKKENVKYEKEILEKDLKSIDEKIEYTTVNLNITEVRNFSNIEKSNSSLFTRLRTAFKDSLLSFKSAIENFFVFLVFALPYIITIVIVIMFVLLFIRKLRKRRRF